jgi:hypothetical protein
MATLPARLFTLATVVLMTGCGPAAGLAPSSGPTCLAAPAGRTSAFSFYDKDEQKVVLYGGESMPRYGRVRDMWAWDGRCWAVLRPADGQLPSARSRGFTAYDPDHQRILLFGGEGGGAPALREVWSWSVGRWTRLPDAPISATASDGAMAYDAARHQLVLVIRPSSFKFGIDDPSRFAMETWLYDGGGWRQASPFHRFPYDPASAYSSAAYDPASRRILVCCLRSSREIWSWDGRDWGRSAVQSPVGDLVEAGDLGILAVATGGPLSPEGQLRPVQRLQADQWVAAGQATTGPASVLAPTYDPHGKELVSFSDIAMATPSSEQVFMADTWTWTLAGGWTKHAGMAPLPALSASPTPATSLSPSPGPTPPSLPTAASGAAALRCRLPVTFSTGFNPDSLAYNAFVAFPDGQVTTVQSFPWGSAKFGTYLPSVNRWLPIAQGFQSIWVAILPDESADATVETEQQSPYTSRLRLVDSATGQERVVPVPPPDGAPRSLYVLRGYAPEGVYVSQAAAGTEDGGHGLWLLDPTTGTRREINPYGYWPVVAAGAAWGYANDDTVEPAPNGWAAFNSVVRLDLRTGQTQPWLVAPGRRVDIMGVDQAARLLVMASNGTGDAGTATVADLRLLTGPGPSRTYAVPVSTIYAGEVVPRFTGVTDANGIWLSEINALYLFDPEHGLRLMVSGGAVLNVAGRCA